MTILGKTCLKFTPLFILVASTSLCPGSTLVVGEGEEYSNPCEAFQASADGDTIMITAGIYEYDESLILNRLADVVILGEEGSELICNSSSDNVIWLNSCDRILLSGLSMRHADPGEDSRCNGNVIGMDSSDDITVMNCEINGCGAVGVYITSCGDVSLLDNFIHGNSAWAVQKDGYGLICESRNLDGLTMIGNTVINNRGGTSVEIVNSGVADYILSGIIPGNNPKFELIVPANGITCIYEIAPDCERLVLDIAMNPEEFIGKTCMVFWREVTFERSGPESWEFLEMIEITAIEVLD